MVPVQTAPVIIDHGQFRIAGRWTKPCYQVIAADGSSQWFTSRAKAGQALAPQSKGQVA
jgi:hypothetical protein